MNKYYFRQEMPWGNFTVIYDEQKRILSSSLAGEIPDDAQFCKWDELSEKLHIYACGKKVNFDEVLFVSNYRSFTKQVMLWLQHNLSWGETLTYGQVAAAIGSPKAARAVGQVMRNNKLPLFVP